MMARSSVLASMQSSTGTSDPLKAWRKLTVTKVPPSPVLTPRTLIVAPGGSGTLASSIMGVTMICSSHVDGAGLAVGLADGVAVGSAEGVAVGDPVGPADGDAVGPEDGETVGPAD